MKPKDLVRSLRACAGRPSQLLKPCDECKKKSGFGCARDLKLEAAALIEKWNEERENDHDRQRND